MGDDELGASIPLAAGTEGSSSLPVQPLRLFTPTRRAEYVSRPNRFVIMARDRGETLRCHCPNPGRLIEFLFPGTPLILEASGEGVERGTVYTAAAVERPNGIIAPLYAAKANNAASAFFLGRIIPGLETVKAEHTIGSSRFDFLCLDSAGRRHLVEVKACSLVEHRVAMFPDAPSLRALRHIEELTLLSAEGYIPHVLFVIMHSSPRVFVPNFHTDQSFASVLCEVGHTEGGPAPSQERPVAVHAALLSCNASGEALPAPDLVPVDLSRNALINGNCGSYLIQLNFMHTRVIQAGALGPITLKKGWYVYTGSAMKNLSSRITRHCRKIRKTPHWHIDYITPWASNIRAFPIRSYSNLECALARAMSGAGGRPVPGFGCSDCSCRSHLFYFESNPERRRSFVEALLLFRHVAAFAGVE